MYIFKRTINPKNEFSRATITCETERDDFTIDELVEEFKYFLLACSFHPDSVDKIQIVDGDE